MESSAEEEAVDSSAAEDEAVDRKTTTKSSPTTAAANQLKMLAAPDSGSEWEQDWHSGGEEASANTAKLDDEGHSSDSSTSSNGRDKCPICLFSFSSQEVGKPENCDHKFCATCIEEWSKNVSTCPIDRKEFLKIICLQDYHTPTVTREISVVVNKKAEAVELSDSDDLTFCRICSRSDREESMLLCDGCNQGYHMECLVPALEQIPAEFWYCDDCFASNEDDDPDDELALQEEIAELMDAVRDYGIPETRLRIRTETVPRILRTRQSERIRDAILARTNRRTFREATREVVPAAADSVTMMPGPSRCHTSVRIMRSYETMPGSSRSAAGTVRPQRRRRRRVTRKTVVVEYDVGNADDKFAVRTKKILRKIKRRRRKKPQTRSSRLRCTRTGNDNSLTGAEHTNQLSTSSRLELCNDFTKDGLTLNRSRAGIPKLSITGHRNDLDYYSSDGGGGGAGDEEDEHSLSGGGGGGDAEGGSMLMATRNRRLFGNLRTLRSRKGGLIIPESSLPATADVLGSIMSEQARWMNISNPRNINKIKIKPDGSLEYEGENEPRRNVSAGRSERPLPVRGAATGAAEMGASGTTTTTGNTSTGNNSGQGSAAPSSSSSSSEAVTNNGTMASNGSETSGVAATSSSVNTENRSTTTPSFPVLRTAAAKKAPPEDKNENDQKSPAVDDSSDEDCPNFSVYSAETMQLAKNISDPADPQNSSTENAEAVNSGEQEEDLVQLDDDDIGYEEEEAETVPAPTEEAKTHSSNNNKKCELELHDDSDWDELTNDNNKPREEVSASAANPPKDDADTDPSKGADQLNTESISEDDEEMIVNDNSRRSLTPCLDEREQQETTEEGDEKKAEDNERDLELISDDEEIADQQRTADSTARGDGDEFKRLSKTTKVRNYRDKGRKSPSPKRSRPEKRQPREGPHAGESPSRSRSSNHHHHHHNNNNNRGNNNRRKDLVRYDVRNVIAERKQRPDKYGRDTTKQAKRSRSKSRSSSLSSLSPDEQHHHNHRRSRSRSRRRRSRSRSRSVRRNRRDSRSPVASAAPGGRRGRSPRQPLSTAASRKRRSPSRFTISPSVSRSPSPLPPVRSPRSRLGRKESPALARSSTRPATSPSKYRNGRGEQARRKVEPSPRRETAQATRRRRRSKSVSSSSSDSESSTAAVGRSKEKAAKYSAEQKQEAANKSWTPPLRAEDRVLNDFKVTVKNSAVVGATSAASPAKRDKKTKKRKGEKKREGAAVGAVAPPSEKEKKREKKKGKAKQQGSKSTPGEGPSKEVFASGDNILVSVNFSSKRGAEANNSSSQQKTIVTLPPSKDQIVTQKQRQERREKAAAAAAAQVVEVRAAKGSSTSTSNIARGPGKSKRSGRTSPHSRETLVVTKNKRHRKVDAKPVAIIDLDGSPFRVMTPSPKAVIVLSDSDGEGGEKKRAKTKTKKTGNEETKKKHSGGTNPRDSSSAKAAISGGGGGGVKQSAKTGGSLSVACPTIRLNSDDDEDVDMQIIGEEGEMQKSRALPVDDNNGPKTPPLPASMKFSMSMRSKSNVLRQVNPLHDAREEAEEQEAEKQQQQQQSEEGKSSVVSGAEQSNRSIPMAAAGGVTGGGGGGADKDTVSTSDQQQQDNKQGGDGGVTNGLELLGSSIIINNNGSAGNCNSNSNNNNNNSSSINKIGPNTPPEPAPTSPDAYDPFEPTKSNSVSPAQDMDLSDGDDDVVVETAAKKTTTTTTVPKKNPVRSGTASAGKIVNSPRHKDLRALDEHKGKIPVSDLVMKLLNSTAGHHHHHHSAGGPEIGSLSPPPPPPPYLEKSLERGGSSANEGASKGQIQILSNVVIQPGKAQADQQQGSAGKSLKHTAAYSTMNSTTTSYSIMKQMQTEAKRMLYAKQKAPPPSVTTSTATTCTSTLTQAMLKKHNAEFTMMDIAAESPYSPGSGDFEDLFEPPMDTSASTRIPSMSGPSPMKGGASNAQAELFDNLFGSHSPPTQGTKWTPSKVRKPQGAAGRSHAQTQSSSAAMNRRAQPNRKHSSIEDDVPDSAVDLVLKENYIQKLNRQERVVEEVKHVLKPHFLRKYITKDDYKEIMKKSVSKICNSRSGEINPQKIKAFIDAYVKKYRYRRKHGGGAGASGTTGSGGGGGAAVTSAVTSSTAATTGTSSSSINVTAGGAPNHSKSRWGT